MYTCVHVFFVICTKQKANYFQTYFLSEITMRLKISSVKKVYQRRRLIQNIKHVTMTKRKNAINIALKSIIFVANHLNRDIEIKIQL